jgi:filamentous hemagglutinin family protein
MLGRHKVLLALALVTTAIGSALAGPNNGTVVNGNATIRGPGTNSVVINQTSQNAIINWQTFNIGNGQTVQILMPNASSAELDRVTGNLGPSEILGSLSSNGRVFLVNPNGILFGQGAEINVGSLLATTSNISNADFMAGRYNFSIPGNPSASIVNQGTITARTGGFAALVAPGVRNTGTITAWLGRVGLASANTFALDLYGDRLIQLNVDDSIASQVIDVSTGQPLKSLVSNEGTLKANGGRVELSAVAAREVVSSVINNSGVIEANSIGTHNGMIVLSAATAGTKPADAPAQTVTVSGKLSAAGKRKGTTGGTIVINGENIALNGATINASGASGGGTVLIGGNGSSASSANGGSGNGNGTLGLWAGGTGGGATSGGGNSAGDFGGSQNTSPAASQGASLAPQTALNASNVTIDAATVINASAIVNGNGGKVVVWSDLATAFYGTILAQGGAQAGNGGSVETSGGTLTFTGSVNTSAPHGTTGTWLLDPTDLTIDTTGAAAIALGLVNNNVIVFTNSDGITSGQGTTAPGVGNITVNAPISWSTSNTLTIDAYNAIIFNASINVMGAGGLVLTARGDNTLAPGAPLISFGNGASVEFTGAPTGSQSLTINNQSYTLLYSMSQVQSINSSSASLSGNYALALPLNASDVTNWTPIGTNSDGTVLNSGNGFNGTFQGLGNTISNLTINSSAQYVGLFGYIGSGIVTNFGLVDGNVTSTYGGTSIAAVGSIAGFEGFGGSGAIINSYATGEVSVNTAGASTFFSEGGLVGNGGTIINSYAASSVNFTGSGTSTEISVGGLLGGGQGRIVNSYSTGAVTLNFPTANSFDFVDVGGLVGFYNSSISNSYATGAVNINVPGTGSILQAYVGGLVGQLNSNSSSIANSYATGAVSTSIAANSSSYENVGGLVGLSVLGAITNSYAEGGIVAPPDSQAGGLVGSNIGGSIVNSYAIGSVDAGANSLAGGLVGLNGNCCEVNGNLILGASITNSYATGTVSGGDFSTVGGLVGSNAGTISQSYAMTGTITVGNFGTAGGLVGINGSCCDVNGNPIPGASITASYAKGAVFSSGINVQLGGLVGENLPLSVISNSQAYGSVTSTANLQANNGNCISNCQYADVGGFVGANYGTITGASWSTAPTSCAASFSCAAGTVSVGSQGQGGGFAGFNQGIINFAFATGNVSGAAGLPSVGGAFNNQTQLGGFVGDNQGMISNAFAIGNVGTAGTAYLNVAGFAASNEGTITKASASGAVLAGDNSTAGGFVGSNSPNGVSICPGCYVGDGFNNNASISNAQASGNVTVGASSVAGGFASNSCGGNCDDGGSFNNVTASGAVTAGHDSMVGGLVGVLGENATLSNSSAQNTLVASAGPNSIVGGIVAVNFGTVSNTTSSAPVTGVGDSYIGGAAGINLGSLNNVTVDPAIIGTGSDNFIGGIAGLNVGSINGSTAQAAITSGPSSEVGGITGVNGSYSNVAYMIPGSSFPNGTIANSSASGSGFSGNVGTQVPSFTPTLPAWLSSCTDGICSVLLNGSLQPNNNPNPNPTPNTPPPPQQQTAQNPPPPTQQTTQLTQIQIFNAPPTPPPLITLVDVTNVTNGATGGTGNGANGNGNGNGGNGNGNGGNGGLGNGKHGGNGAPPGVRLIDLPHMPLPPGSGLPPLGETRFLSNELVLQFDTNNLTPQQIAALAARFGLTVVSEQTIGILGRTIYTFRIGNGQSVRELIQLLNTSGLKVAAQPQYSYGLTQDGAAADEGEVADPAQYIVQKLQLAAAHRISKGENVVIAVIDSAIDAEQPDFAGGVIDRYDAGCGSTAPDAHGTGMAGAIASHVQLVGVAPSAKIIAICAFGGSGGSPEATSVKIIRGLDYAVQHGAKIVNMSFAGPYDPALAQALQVAREKGVLIVAAAGNAGAKSPPLYPGADPNVLAVTATDENDRLFGGANQGNYVALAAPGVNILVPAPNGGVQMTTGTSVATANISGVAALLLASKPSRSPEELRAILVETAKHLGAKGSNPQFGAGLVDPVRALQEVRPVAGKSAAATPVGRVQ